MPTILWILLGVVVLLAVWFLLTYNRFIALRNRAEEAWSDIEVQLKRRYDLIPNLVNTVKGYAGHEEHVFSQVAEARSAAMSAKTPAEHAQAENALSQTLKSLFAVAEAYPQLRAVESFLDLQSNLRDAEDKIQASRRFYNGMVRDYNTAVQQFPSSLLANLFSFAKRDFYDAPDIAYETPAVSFS
ncbi:MAG TPA: LemA family protein [Patescibacteria group bacterium]|nr:LemA family protein [Patescibacteria group bacterium]